MRDQLFGNNLNTSKFFSGRNYEQIEIMESLLSCDAESSSLLSKNLKIKIYRTIILPFFCMGVKVGRSH